MKANHCQKQFNTGQAWRQTQRKTHPMPCSTYKIVETAKRWSDFLDELINIGRCASGDKPACYCLMHCAREDKGLWVKRLPESMCDSLSRNVVEVLYALQGDGVPQHEIDALERMVRAQVPRLIALGERARQEAKSNWAYLSKQQLANGNGVITEFVAEMLALVMEVTRHLRGIPRGRTHEHK